MESDGFSVGAGSIGMDSIGPDLKALILRLQLRSSHNAGMIDWSL